MSAMLESLKEFVRKPTSQNQAEDTVVIHVTHANLKQHFIEIRVDLHVLLFYPTVYPPTLSHSTQNKMGFL